MRVMFVDDESIIREGLRTIISWEKAGFTELMEAPDAMTALDDIRAARPELIIADIFMPEMSGIEFARRVRREFPSIRIILLTGYEKFEYAREAVEIGVAKYLVKPVFPSELMEAVQDVYRDIREERSEQRWMEDAGRRLRQYVPVIREKLWHDLAAGALIGEREIAERMAELGVEAERDTVIGIAIRLDARQVEGKYGERDAALIQFAVRNIAEEVLAGHWHHFVNAEPPGLIGICHTDPDNGLLETLDRSIASTLDIAPYIGVGRVRAGLSSTFLSVREAEEAASLLLMLGEPGYMRYDESASGKNATLQYPYAQEKQLLHELAVRWEADPAWIEPFMEAVGKQGAGAAARKLFYVQLLSSIYRVADELELSAQLAPFQSGYSELIHMETEAAVREFFVALFARMMEHRQRVQAGLAERLAEAAQSVMRERYRDADLSVASLADELGITPNYLSRIFHRVTGSTATEYLTELRVNEAKALLARSPLKVFEIAEQVGYMNAHYFSVVFKKHTGLTPLAYRERQEADGR